ncbi:MAG: histidine kinase, partial [Propionibacteriaceae bacterium]|nr:histidine kinase [Propionibacteriaceae bacterium]
MSASETVFPPGATRRDWMADGILAVSLALLAIALHLFWFGRAEEPDLTVVALSFALVLPLALRRHAPLLMLALVTVAGVLQLFFLDRPTASLLAVPVVAYSVARWVPGYASRSVLVVGVFASVLGPMSWFGPTTGNASEDMLFWGACLGAVLTPYAIGRRAREVAGSRSNDIRAAEERYRLLLAEREQQARLAEASARAVIARELHDIVAHSLSVMIVQAEGGRAASVRKPEAADAALDTIAETGREALHEMRRIVGVLRAGPEAEERPTYAPTPTLQDIPELVVRTSERARLVVHGQPGNVPSALALTIYRVIQEALTNFLKHAGPQARATVSLSYGPRSIIIDVQDDGEGVEDPTDGGGNGLRGMYERVTSMGGTLRAGPRTNVPGFRVLATIPVHPAPPT